MARIIVSGGSGYIGQEVVRAALNVRDGCYRGGHSVVNIDIRPPRPLHEGLQRCDGYCDVGAHPRVTFIQADLANPDEASRALDAAMNMGGEVLGVANLSGLVKYGHGYERLYRPNVQTVKNLAGECAARQLFLLHFSGTAVHGNGLWSAVKESDRINPVEGYGRSKAESERAIFNEVQARGLQALIFRSTAPIGPDLQVSELNKMYETIVTAPILPAVRRSNNTYVSNEDVGRTFVYAMENRDRVACPQPKTASDIVYNLGASRPLSDAEVMAHLQKSIFGAVRKPIVQMPPTAVMAVAYLSTLGARGQSLLLQRTVDPVLHYELARLFKGWHYQDQTRFTSVFCANGFTLKHDEPEKVLDVGTVYKFLTDWVKRPRPPRMALLVESFVAERTRAAYD